MQHKWTKMYAMRMIDIYIFFVPQLFSRVHRSQITDIAPHDRYCTTADLNPVVWEDYDN